MRAAKSLSSSGVRVFAALISSSFAAMARYSSAPRSSTEPSLRNLTTFSRVFLFRGVIATSVLEISSSENTMLPLGIKPLESSIPAKVFVNTLFPEPDSPTMARDSCS